MRDAVNARRCRRVCRAAVAAVRDRAGAAAARHPQMEPDGYTIAYSLLLLVGEVPAAAVDARRCRRVCLACCQQGYDCYVGPGSNLNSRYSSGR